MLLSAVDVLMEQNHSLSRRLQRAMRTSSLSSPDMDEPSPDPAGSSFESDLEASHVYRRIRRETMDFSMDSSTLHPFAWSVLSDLSLDDISRLSVIALPVYADEITNPEHYDFGHSSPLLCPELPAAGPTRSIYHDCVEVQLQLSKFQWCAEFQADREIGEGGATPLEAVISIFRRGFPLLLLFNEVDGSRHEKWKPLLALRESTKAGRLAVLEFVQACHEELEFAPSECFTLSDLEGEDTTAHVKGSIHYRLPTPSYDSADTNAR